jgi:hypothetical protein
MQNINTNYSGVTPINQTNILRGNGDCDQVKKAWIAVDGKLGRQRVSPKFIEKIGNLYELKCTMRFCYEDTYLEGEQQFRHGNVFPRTTEQARLHALAVALSEFNTQLQINDLDSLKCWKLGIMSIYPEFLEDIKTRIQQLVEDDDFICPSVTHPIKVLRHFNSVELLLIDPKDEPIVAESKNVKIKWN